MIEKTGPPDHMTLYHAPVESGGDQGRHFGFLLDARCMDLPADLWDRMAGPFARALAEMKALEAGAIANPDEQRMVGHYWLRSPDLAPTAAIRAEIEGTVDRIRSFAADVHSGRIQSGAGSGPFRNLLVIGIGGSALGPQLVAAALGGAGDRMRPFFFDNTDPDGMDRTLQAIAATPAGLSETLVLVISKSGGTRETRNGQLTAKAAFERAGLSFAGHAVAVTGEGSELHRTALAEKWRTAFPMWDWVGGRTSELSAVGLLPAALQGIDIDGLLAGARYMDRLTREPDPRRNPAAILALAWRTEAERGRRDMVVLPYKDRLELFSRYLQQLVMESLGKERDLSGKVVHEGIAVYGNKGSTDQHAYVQQLREGLDNFFAVFIEVLRDGSPQAPPAPQDRGPAIFVEDDVQSGDYLLGFLLGTRQALHEKGRRSLLLTVPDASARSLGMLIALFERAVGYYGFLAGINAYHQPGVEAGKKAAGAVLALQRRIVAALTTEPRSARELCGSDQDAYTAWKILEHLAANDRVRRHLPPGEHPLSARYEKI